MITKIEVIEKESHFSSFYSIIWKAVFDESRTCSSEGGLRLTGRSTLQYGVKKPK